MDVKYLSRYYELRDIDVKSGPGFDSDLYLTSMLRSSSYLDKYLSSKRRSWWIILRQCDEVGRILTSIWRQGYVVRHLLTSVCVDKLRRIDIR